MAETINVLEQKWRAYLQQKKLEEEEAEIWSAQFTEKLTALRLTSLSLPIPEGGYFPEAVKDSAQNYQQIFQKVAYLEEAAYTHTSLKEELYAYSYVGQKRSMLLEKLLEAEKELVDTYKQVTEEVTHRLNKDLTAFIRAELPRPIPFQRRRQEIKNLQEWLLSLPVSPFVISEMRLRLSAYWDDLKELEQQGKVGKGLRRAKWQEWAKETEAKINRWYSEWQQGLLTKERLIYQLHTLSGLHRDPQKRGTEERRMVEYAQSIENKLVSQGIDK